MENITMQVGDEIAVDIHALSFGGEGIARHQSFVFFVPRGVPGDRVGVRIVRLKKRYGSARIVRILKPSQFRMDTECPLFEAGGGDTLGCGGCQWLHIHYLQQLEWKKRFVEDSLRRIGGLKTQVEGTIPAAELRRSRSKLSASVGNDGALGLCIEHSPEVLQLSNCPMESPQNNAALLAFRNIYTSQEHGPRLQSVLTQIHLRSSSIGAVSLCFYARHNDPVLKSTATSLVEQGVIVGAGVIAERHFAHLAGARSLSIHSGRIDYEVPVDAFFQTNLEQAEVLLERVKEGLATKSGDRVLDLYSGVGYFALDLALDGARVTAVEGHPAASAAARRTAKRLGVEGRFIRRGVNASLFGNTDIGKRYDRIVLDPPRAGCGEEVARSICSLGAKRIVYVSCSPDTLARDLAKMTSSGYRILSTTPIDMFPQTYHVETITVLEPVKD